MGTSPTNNPKLDQVISTLQHVKASGQFWCLVGTNDIKVPGLETSRLDGGAAGNAHVLKDIAWMLSGDAQPHVAVVGEVYGRESSRTGGGDLVVALYTKDNRLCLLACHVGESLSDVATTLTRNSRELQAVMAVFDERFDGSDRMAVDASGWPKHHRRDVKVEERNGQQLPHFVYSLDK
jgi:hypothetical protein